MSVRGRRAPSRRSPPPLFGKQHGGKDRLRRGVSRGSVVIVAIGSTSPPALIVTIGSIVLAIAHPPPIRRLSGDDLVAPESLKRHRCSRTCHPFLNEQRNTTLVLSETLIANPAYSVGSCGLARSSNSLFRSPLFALAAFSQVAGLLAPWHAAISASYFFWISLRRRFASARSAK
jgi:hypothetical protein